LLRPIDGLPNDPWIPCYDCCFGFVVRAETEQEAREFAEKEAGDESDKSRSTRTPLRKVWLDAALTTCTELTTDGEVGIVIRDFHAA
jgi:hypothetical protein